jgi:glycosyltransferase involved in cell wall biosynthesis
VNRKLIMFINDWGSNPNERVFYIADYFKRLGCDIVFIGRTYKDMPNREYFSSIHGQKSNLTKYLRFVVRMKLVYYGIKKIISDQPTHLYIRSDYLSFVFGLLVYFTKIKLIYETHGMTYKELQYSNASKLKIRIRKYIEESIINRFSDSIVVNSYGTKEYLISKYSMTNNIFCILNGINTDVIDNIEPIYKSDIPAIGFIGNWERWIRIEDLLMVSKLTNKVQIVIVGKGEGYNKYKNRYPDVKFTGLVSREVAMGYLHSFDVCISPWDDSEIFKEKSARKTFEYLRAGKPIVVSNVVGKEEFLIEGKNCLLYKSGNSEDLLNSINSILTNKKLYKEMSSNNLELSNNFTWESVIVNSGIHKFIENY